MLLTKETFASLNDKDKQAVLDLFLFQRMVSEYKKSGKPMLIGGKQVNGQK